jgi:transmembrane sensor
MEERVYRYFQGDLDEVEAPRVDAWRRASPQNEEVFRQLENLYNARQLLTLALDHAPPPAAREILRRAAVRRRSARRLTGWAAAAAAAVVLIAVAVRRPSTDPADGSLLRAAEFVTLPDEQSTVQLGDGSVVRLGRDSRVTVLSVLGERRVSLSGRAFFAVARDENHPFTVVTDRGEVLVKGTRFDLEARGGRLQLTVVEGLVQLRAGNEAVQVKGGEVAHALDGNRVVVGETESVPATTRWMGKFVAFESTPLRVVAEELERRFGVRMRIDDSAVAERPVTSWSTDRTAPEIISAICAALNVNCAVTDSVTVVK